MKDYKINTVFYFCPTQEEYNTEKRLNNISPNTVVFIEDTKKIYKNGKCYSETGKADKDSTAVPGNLAVFDSNGNPIDSGKNINNFEVAGESAIAKEEIIGSATEDYNTLGKIEDIVKQNQEDAYTNFLYSITEGSRLRDEVTTKLNILDEHINNILKDDVIIVTNHSDISEPDKTKIYREPTPSSNPTMYIDWMYDEYNEEWKKLAEYTFPGIDTEPTLGSENLVTSGGVYSIKRKVDEHSDMLRTAEENGAYFTDGSGNVFMQYEEATGFDVANPSESFKDKVNGGLQTELQETKTNLSNLSKDTEETGAYFTDDDGNVFIQYEPETGFDVAKVSQSFKDKLGGGTGRNNIVRDIEEDVISLVTDEAGNSAVNWSNEQGLDANKVSYHLAKSIQGRQIKDMEEWRDLAVGMFIHWGVYSVLAGHYQGLDVDGQTVDYLSTIIAEWIMKLAKIPKAAYQAYESQFTAVNWDADAIAKLAYDCGMKYIVITAKHHEGFALYNSQIIPWNISTSGAAGKDPMQELKNACEKYGVKFCIYYSVGRDWTAEGGFDQDWANNNVDPYTNTQHEAYVSSCANALKEIVDRYNPYIIWYDGYINTTLNEIVYDAQKNYFPQVIVNDRLCHNPAKGDYATGETSYFQGDRSVWPNAENCYCVMKNSWGYNENQDTPEYAYSLYDLLCKQILESRARTQNALINIGPKGDGSVSVNAINALNSLAGFVNKYGSFENTKGLNYYTFPSWGRAIIKGRTLRCYVWGGNTTILVDGVYTKPIKSVKVWDIQDPESVNNYTIVSDYRISVTNIPVSAQHPSVVDIEFGNDIVFEEYSTIIDGDNTFIGASAFQAHGSMYLINFDSVVQFGGWTQSGRITSTFRYDGISGNHTVKLYIPSKSSNGIPIIIKITDLSNNSTTTLTATSDETITQENVYLTNGRNYEVEISKTTNEWLNLSQIEFISI